MTDLGRYILEEWAEEYREGRLGRREFLRRIAVFAGGAAGATALVATLGVVASSDEVRAAAASPAPPAAPTASPVVPPDDPSLDTRLVSFPGTPPGPQTVFGYLAQPKGAARVPGVVVIHENRGLVDHIKDVARRVAKLGYVALAPDLVSTAGGTDKLPDPAQASSILGQTPPDQLAGMGAAGVRYVASLPSARADRLGVMGFCFGGAVTWRVATQVPELHAAVPFYGPNPPLEDVPKIRAAVLAFYGALDERVDAGIPAMRAALDRAKVVYDMVVEPNASHAFFNNTGASYNAAAAQDAWAHLQTWFGRYLTVG
ncbi:MAG TPA: dienelactone hydrolase family protein [bacterium]|nr:dienelactone hydrolase family protein [bacterium]